MRFKIYPVSTEGYGDARVLQEKRQRRSHRGEVEGDRPEIAGEKEGEIGIDERKRDGDGEIEGDDGGGN